MTCLICGLEEDECNTVLCDRINRLEFTLGTLIGWLRMDLGEEGTKQLYEMLSNNAAHKEK